MTNGAWPLCTGHTCILMMKQVFLLLSSGVRKKGNLLLIKNNESAQFDCNAYDDNTK